MSFYGIILIPVDQISLPSLGWTHVWADKRSGKRQVSAKNDWGFRNFYRWLATLISSIYKLYVRRLCIAVSCKQPTSLSVAINHEVLPTLVEVTGLTPIKHCIFRRSPAWSVLNRALNECQYEDGHSRTQTWNGSTQQNIKLRNLENL